MKRGSAPTTLRVVPELSGVGESGTQEEMSALTTGKKNPNQVGMAESKYFLKKQKVTRPFTYSKLVSFELISL